MSLIFEALAGDSTKLEIVIFCNKGPKKTSEIAQKTGFTLVTTARWVAYLEQVEAITYTQAGWISTKEAMSIIKKFFT